MLPCRSRPPGIRASDHATVAEAFGAHQAASALRACGRRSIPYGRSVSEIPGFSVEVRDGRHPVQARYPLAAIPGVEGGVWASGCRDWAPSPLGKVRVSHSPCSSAPPRGRAPRPSSSCGRQSLPGRGAGLAGHRENSNLRTPHGGTLESECSRRKDQTCYEFETMYLRCHAGALLGSQRYRGRGKIVKLTATQAKARCGRTIWSLPYGLLDSAGASGQRQGAPMSRPWHRS